MTYSLFAEQNKILHWQGRSSPTLLLPLLVVERKQQYNRERWPLHHKQQQQK
jgi:hypothetical protein